MAVRFDASGERYTRALSLGSQANYTITCWGRIAVDRNSYSTFWQTDNGSEALMLQTDLDGTSLIVYDDATGGQIANGPSLTAGTWYFFALAVSGTSGTLYWRAATTEALSTDTWTGATRTLTNLQLGDNIYSEWLNGDIAAFKLWTAGLTLAEVVAESQQYVPGRTVGLQAWYPLVRAETTDYSGNGRTLSGGTGATTEDGPPIPWRRSAAGLILPAAASGATASPETATATAAANDATASVTAAPSEATAIGAALDVAGLTVVVAPAGEASGNGTAETPTGLVAQPVDTATATAAAQDPTATVIAPVPEAAATATALDATSGITATPPAAPASAAANDPSSTVTATPAEATGVGAAYDATGVTGSAVTATPAEATATATANDPSPAVVVTAFEATATAAANNATGAVAAQPTEAIATATTQDAAGSAVVTPLVAAAVAVAFDATGSASSGTTATAQEASGTAVAFDPTVHVVAHPEVAEATATAANATGVVEGVLPDGGVVLRVREITAQLESYVAQLGVVESVNGGELRHMIGTGLRAALWFDRIEPIAEASGLDSITVRLEMKIRVYGNLQREPSDEVEPEMLAAVDAVMNAFAEGYTLEGEVRDVDFYGAHGQRFSAQAGYLDLQDGTCRVETITVPLIVNDVWQLVA